MSDPIANASLTELRRAVTDVIALRDELATGEFGAATLVSRAFAKEIDMALRGQRRKL